MIYIYVCVLYYMYIYIPGWKAMGSEAFRAGWTSSKGSQWPALVPLTWTRKPWIFWGSTTELVIKYFWIFKFLGSVWKNCEFSLKPLGSV